MEPLPGEDVNIPQAQRRPPAQPLADFVGRKDRDAAMAAAHATGDYSQRQIAEASGVHSTTVGRAVQVRAVRTDESWPTSMQ